MRLNRIRFSLLSGMYLPIKTLIGMAISNNANKTKGFAMPTKKAVMF